MKRFSVKQRFKKDFFLIQISQLIMFYILYKCYTAPCKLWIAYTQLLFLITKLFKWIRDFIAVAAKSSNTKEAMSMQYYKRKLYDDK
jgi:hypothetical protein